MGARPIHEFRQNEHIAAVIGTDDDIQFIIQSLLIVLPFCGILHMSHALCQTFIGGGSQLCLVSHGGHARIFLFLQKP